MPIEFEFFWYAVLDGMMVEWYNAADLVRRNLVPRCE